MGVKQEKIASRLKRCIGKAIQEELKDPRIGFVTITDVQVTKDLKSAEIYFSTLGNRTQKNNTMNALKSAKNYLKKLIAGHLRLRYMPEIRFVEDISMERAQNIYKILEEIKKEKNDSSDYKN